MIDKTLSLFGLMRKANKLAFGNDLVLESIKENKAKLIVFAKDASQHVQNDVSNEAEKNDIECINLKYTKDEINSATGKFCAVISICDEGFSKKLKSLIEEDNKEE